MMAAIAIAVMVVAVSVTAYFVLQKGEPQSEEGVLLDFGDYTGYWMPVETEGVELDDAVSAAFEKKDIKITYSDDFITSVDGISARTGESWGLWTFSVGSGWKKIPYSESSMTLSKGTYPAVALTAAGNEPLLPCVDAMGKDVFNGTSEKIVSLSAVGTEILCKTGKLDSLVAADAYSNYPAEVVTRGISKEWGFYQTPPTAEIVSSYDPDLVVGEKDNHDALLNSLRSSGIRCISLYKAFTLEDVYRNIWMTGAATGNDAKANETINGMKGDLEELLRDHSAAIAGLDGKKTVILFGGEWYVAGIGQDTFINDIISRLGVVNMFPDSGWIMDKEYMTTMTPEIVIFIADEDLGGADIKTILGQTGSHLPGWPNATGDTWKGVELITLYGEDGDKFLRAGPRIVEALAALLEEASK
jgi:iron complex transport system substrate-binding protein